MTTPAKAVVRWGIIGCGNVTEANSGPAFQKARGSALAAVMRRNGPLAEDYARRHGVPRWYDDARKLIEDPEVDAVYIATPPGSHLEYALQVAAAGKPAHVEKPMARNHAECQRMLAAFRAAKLPLFVAYSRRSLPRFIKAKELIGAGRLGEITGVSYQAAGPPPSPEARTRAGWHLTAAQSGGGLFLDVGCHTLDILDYMVGPLTNVRGAAANLSGVSDVEDAVAMSFRTPAGALGVAQWNWVSAVNEDVIQITGTLGRLVLSSFGNKPMRLLATDQPEECYDLPNPLHVQQPLIQTIVDELQGLGQCPSHGESAVRTAKVMDTVLADYYGGRDDEFWDRPQTWPGRRIR